MVVVLQNSSVLSDMFFFSLKFYYSGGYAQLSFIKKYLIRLGEMITFEPWLANFQMFQLS